MVSGLEQLSVNLSHGGEQRVCRHASSSTGTDMVFSAFIPPHQQGQRLPVLIYLSGLTCTHANVTEKGEYRAACARHGIIFIAPDTSPRGDDVPDDPDGAYDFGLGAGFYVNATQSPFDRHYHMRRYIEDELPELIAAHIPQADISRMGLTGHSMGGHGALTIGLRNPDRFSSVSAIAPICSPIKCNWGQKALTGYLGPDQKAWRSYDACALIQDGHRLPDILVDQGEADDFLDSQLKPDLLEAACQQAEQPLTLRRHSGYDHSYYFISTVLPDHVAWHAERL
ncbi:MAG: S-formylglutathione hydrolase [Alphaproteobacteria bacterium]